MLNYVASTKRIAGHYKNAKLKTNFNPNFIKKSCLERSKSFVGDNRKLAITGARKDTLTSIVKS